MNVTFRSKNLLHIATSVLALHTSDLTLFLMSFGFGNTAVAFEDQILLFLESNFLNLSVVAETHPVHWDAAVNAVDKSVKLHEFPLLYC